MTLLQRFAVTAMAPFTLAFTLSAETPAPKLTYLKDIKPIFSKACYECHGEKKQKGKLRLDTKEGVFKDLGGYFTVVKGKSKDSEAYLRTITKDEDDVMPPTDFEVQLTKPEIELIRSWIDAGALWGDE